MPYVSTHSTAARPRQKTGASSLEDLLFDAFFGGGVAGSTIALFFLVVDLLQGQALHTPSVIGSTLFTDVPAAAVTGVQADMVVYFSMVHLAAFGVLGALLSLISRRFALVDEHLLARAAIVFTILTATIVLADLTLMPGIISAVGLWAVLAANALTGITHGIFLGWSHGMSDATS